jgi:hypothetical protein
MLSIYFIVHQVSELHVVYLLIDNMKLAYLMYNEVNRQHEARLPDVQ